jgi:hypothetical protein
MDELHSEQVKEDRPYMPTTEHTINDSIARVLRETRHAWKDSQIVSSENTGMVKGGNKRPDILVIESNVSPVVIETEVLPALTVEGEATSRLGEVLVKNGRTILSSIAVRLPTRLREKQGEALAKEIRLATDLDMALYTGSSPLESTRWPGSGWIVGSVSDLSTLAQAASVPPDVIELAADRLVNGVTEAAGLLGEMSHSHSGAIKTICNELRQAPGEQTLRMATTMLANAFVFQETLAGGPGGLADVKSLGQLRSAGMTKPAVLAEWETILNVNYWPIFDIARRILEVIPADYSKTLIQGLSATAEELLENRLMRSHDLTGAVFQRLIVDRKFLAAYYTTPAAAALLAALAIDPGRPLNGISWSNPDGLKQLRLADFACGTGTLISTAYQRVGQLHELCGGDSEAIHPEMMADALVACDVLPAAAHLTASMLAGSHPTARYKRSSVMTVAYGRQKGTEVALGSLDLLDPQKKLEVLAITAKAAGGEGETEEDPWVALPHKMFDLVIMNPPFTRSTGHEGKKKSIPHPMFAAFKASKADQALMAKATKELTRGTSAHGNAGEASIFLVLADRKLKVGGTLALVMPLWLLSGEAGEKSRVLLAKRYKDLVLISIAGAGDDDSSFSADTGMAECLVVGVKVKTDEAEFLQDVTKRASERAIFVVLKERPPSQLFGSSTARQIRSLIEAGNIRKLEDGPVGGTQIHFGDDVVGQAMSAPLPTAGVWNPSRIADLSLAQAAYQLSEHGLLWLPGIQKSQAKQLPVSLVGHIGHVGPYHSDIDGLVQNGGIRGPFEHVPVQDDQTPTYPILWSHKADRERAMMFEADCEGLIRDGADDDKVAKVWASASHCHFNQNFRFNSQATAMQYTSRKTMGGRAWISIKLKSSKHEKAVVAWANTSIGLLLHWYHANKQQSGRGNIGRSSLDSLPVLDCGGLTEEQLTAAVKIFDDLKSQDLLAVNEIHKDPVRRDLDERFAAEVLGLPVSWTLPGGTLALLRAKLSNEPGIAGSKDRVDDDAEGDEENAS